ncbi:HEAT_2 domain containing protein [Streptomyces laurentii]|uniref:HEAT_2 domain containing protein n=1 Tax=Streptomyces laurentii TaxID=39478 RepID=A0A169P7X3_STRLU|nr:HEAT_2 domain containing protein [Streptomyces laurentii]
MTMSASASVPEEDAKKASVLRGLEHPDASVRVRAALAIGSRPDAGYVAPLIERCRVEPDFSVRETLTWALTRHAADATVPPLVAEVRSDRPRARSQALHTLSKIGDRRAWPVITPALLADSDVEVARTAWRAAAVLVPEGEERALAVELAKRLGWGAHDTQLSLSRALIALGEVMLPLLAAAETDPDPDVRAHAGATVRLWRDPDAGFASAVEEAKRVVALGGQAGGDSGASGSGASGSGEGEGEGEAEGR